MLPEERAKAIIETFMRETTPETTSGADDCWRIEKHIASALRQAENDAIERAARLMGRKYEGVLRETLQREIRALKNQEP